MAFLIDGANTLDDGDLITNSLRFNGSNAYLNRTTSTASGNTKLTISYWTKGHSTGSSDVNYHFVKFDDVNNRIYLGMWDREIRFYQTTSGSATFYYRTQSNTFADPSAWYHFCLIVDTTDGTAGDRIQLYVNGTRYTDWQTETQPSQNATLRFATDTSTALHIGRYADSTDYYFDGYMAEIHYIDGQNKAASDFGETNDNGVWVPKEYTGTYGDEGFYLQFKETGTSANASGKGADTSGNGNHFDDNNMDAYDITTDTPNNNFATFNPLHQNNSVGIGDVTKGSISEGNTHFDNGGAVGGSERYYRVYSTIAIPSSGKWYWEVKPTKGTSGLGFRWVMGLSELHAKWANSSFVEWTDGSYSLKGDGHIWYNNNDHADYTDLAVDNIISFKYDADNRDLYFAINGTYENSGNAVLTSTQITTTTEKLIILQVGSEGDVETSVNFGNAPYSISSGNADANGYGNFEYAVPSGYYALCTKNLGKYG